MPQIPRRFHLKLISMLLFISLVAFAIHWYSPHDIEASPQQAKKYNIEDTMFECTTVTFNYQRLFPTGARTNGAIVFRDPKQMNYVVPNPDGHKLLFHLADQKLLEKLKHPKIDEIRKSLNDGTTDRVKSIVFMPEAAVPENQINQIELFKSPIVFVTNLGKTYCIIPKFSAVHPDVSYLGPTLAWEFKNGTKHPFIDATISVPTDVMKTIKAEIRRTP